jgi:hypothetical protein
MVKKTKKAKYNKKYFKKNRKTNKHINRTFRKKYTKKRGGTNKPSHRRNTPNRVRSKKEDEEQRSGREAFLKGKDLFEPDKTRVETPSQHRRATSLRLRSAKTKAFEEDKKMREEREEELSRIMKNETERINRLGENTYKKVSERKPSQQSVTHKDEIIERSNRAATSFKNQ